MSLNSRNTLCRSLLVWSLLLTCLLLGSVRPAGAETAVDLFTANSCAEHLARHAAAALLDQEFQAFQGLAEEALAIRAVTIKVGRQLKDKAEAGQVLSGSELNLLSSGLAMHLELRKKLYAVAEAHECWLDLDEDDLRSYGLSSDQQLEGVMISLAAALVLYDNYLLTATLFEGDAKLRQLLNEEDKGYRLGRDQLMKVALSYNSALKRARVRRAMRFYEKALAEGRHRQVNPYLATLIDQSPSYDMVRQWSPFRVISRKLGFLENLTVDTAVSLENDGISLFSMLFGNAVGLVETRKGKLYHRPEVYTDLRGTLKCGDILLEKTPFRLTDKLIPGYWGHAAIWIGTEAELRELGLWDHPLVQEHRREILAGDSVVEALRSGVEMNPLARFLNIDSIGVLRRSQLSVEERRQIVLQALRQVGKAYDFSFDVESLDKVYCSKLIYLAYHGIDWPTKESFGRATISPDDVASGLFSGKPLQLVAFYHDGKKVRKRPLAMLASLMEVSP